MGKTIDTLIKSKKKKAEERWYPIPVDTFRNGFIAMRSDVEGYHPLVDNLAYNLQYIQFFGKGNGRAGIIERTLHDVGKDICHNGNWDNRRHLFICNQIKWVVENK